MVKVTLTTRVVQQLGAASRELCVFEEAVVSAKSVMQKIVALSVIEAETIAAVQCA